MIYKQCTMTIAKNGATLDEDIYLYRLDKNIELHFTIVNNKYKFDKSDLNNIIAQTQAVYFQVRLYKNAEIKYTFAIQPTDGGQAILTITDDLIDDPIEVGDYDFQISLLDEEKTSMISMPIVSKQLHVCEPLVSDDATMGKAILGLSKLATGEIKNAFDSDGNYVREIHKDGDILSAELINKFEEALDTNTKAIKNGIGTSYDDTEIKTDINTIKTDLGTETLTTTTKTVKGAVNEVAAQYKDIAKKVENVGQPTQEQIDNAINKAIEDGKITGTGGINSTAKTLLQTILQNAVYTSNQSANITALISALGNNEGGGGDTPTVKTYTITNNLTHCSNSNASTSVNENSNYAATITPSKDYTLADASVNITMGGTDITSTAYNNGAINITSVTGNIVITITATSSSSSSEMVTDGLVNYFDFRNAKYNNDGAGGSTIINATQGNGSLYTWAKNTVVEQNNYGIKANRSFIYNPTSVGTTSASLGASFTVIFKCYLTSTASPLFTQEYAALSNLYKLVYKPKYKTTSSTGTVTGTNLGGRVSSEYDTVTLIVDNNICKLYFGTTLMQTNDGSTITDFQAWYDQLNTIGILGGNAGGYLTQIAVYNKALSEVQLVDMLDYLKTLEVSK